MLSELDKAIIGLISRDIPLTKKPFKDLANKLSIDERILIGRIKSFKADGLMRKFSASLNHKKIGFRHNAMVAWNVPDGSVERAGNIMASYGEVSHCYERRRAPGWGYNLYSMIHGRTSQECISVVNKIYKRIGNPDHRILFSSREYKKTGARY